MCYFGVRRGAPRRRRAAKVESLSYSTDTWAELVFSSPRGFREAPAAGPPSPPAWGCAGGRAGGGGVVVVLPARARAAAGRERGRSRACFQGLHIPQEPLPQLQPRARAEEGGQCGPRSAEAGGGRAAGARAGCVWPRARGAGCGPSQPPPPRHQAGDFSPRPPHWGLLHVCAGDAPRSPRILQRRRRAGGGVAEPRGKLAWPRHPRWRRAGRGCVRGAAATARHLGRGTLGPPARASGRSRSRRVKLSIERGVLVCVTRPPGRTGSAAAAGLASAHPLEQTSAAGACGAVTRREVG